MPKYVKRPETFEARQFDGSPESSIEFMHWIKHHSVSYDSYAHTLKIHAIGGLQPVRPGDWVIRDNNHALTLLSDEQFHMVYEPYGDQ